MALNIRFTPCQSLLASLYYKRKDYQDAERLYWMIVARDSMNPEYWARLGNCLEKLGEWKPAVDCFRSAAKYDTANSSYLSRLGQAYFELKKFDSAAVSYTRAALLEEDNPVLFLNAGLSYARLDSLEKALQSFHRSFVATHIERLGFLYGQIGGLYYVHKQFRQAARAYQSSLQYDPGNKRAVFFLAHSKEEIKDFAGAAAFYGRFLKLASGDTTASDLVPYARKRFRALTRTR
jgi:tetratricopeptide (TPR) repeat protein